MYALYWSNDFQECTLCAIILCVYQLLSIRSLSTWLMVYTFEFSRDFESYYAYAWVQARCRSSRIGFDLIPNRENKSCYARSSYYVRIIDNKNFFTASNEKESIRLQGPCSIYQPKIPLSLLMVRKVGIAGSQLI